jgi:hypothetical protein
MPKLSSLLAEKAKGEVQIGGSTLQIVFFVMLRERFSDDEWTSLLAMTGREYLKTLLPRVLVSWDLVDDNDQAVPVTAEAIEQHHIPDALLFAIERRIFGSDLSGKATSSNLPGT